MTHLQLDAFREILKGTQKARADMSDGAEMILEALKAKQIDFEKNKTRIENDIKRGAKLSRGKFPR